MDKRKIKLLFLILSILLIFIFGVIYEIDYRVLTRKSIRYFSDNGIDYYGGKDFRFFETDIAFILTLIPISIYILTRELNSFSVKFIITLLFLICIAGFYCFYCYAEVQIIKMTITNPTYRDGSLMYHHRNVNYRGILFFTIISSSCIMGITVKKMRKGKTE